MSRSTLPRIVPILAILLLAHAFLPLRAVSETSGGGKDWGIEQRSYVDPVSGVTILELTDQGTNSFSNNLYFHFSNFTADDHHLIFISDRTGAQELYKAEVNSGRIIQLTSKSKISPSTACPDPRNASRLFCMRGAELVALNIQDFSITKIGEIPQPHLGGFQQPTLDAGGKWFTVTKQRDEQNWEIGRIHSETGVYQTVLTQGFRIGHVQHSPTDPVIFYAWETGGYAPQRTWLVNSDGTANRPFYATTSQTNWFTPLKEWVTHEAWGKDTGDMTMINDKVGIMLVKKDGSTRLVKEGQFWHAAARPDGKFIVTDDLKGNLWLLEVSTGNLRLLASGTRNTIRAAHAHASFDHAGRFVQFHSGRTRETVALIDLSRLPAVPAQ